ncbi:MAG: Na+/H+ antiporter NhaC family protein [Ruminococcaceae bacterium]|nr:Na+/H+ antiporter NhaC family protein [Oscillospiraceae bacterium]
MITNSIIGVLLLGIYGFLIYQKVAVPGFTASGTIWALLPPVTAIGLALLTKEVYSSLFLGIVSGALLLTDFDVVKATETVFRDGIIANIADSWNAGILVFLVALGIIVALLNAAGGSVAYGKWAARRIKGRKGAMLATFGLGALIFVDDYFNCLTVGSVMRPITDEKKISRAKLAYLIDATAAPVCMIAPISSWAAAVSSSIESEDGLSIFIQAIPYNFYSLLTLAAIIVMTVIGLDFGAMRTHEINAVNGDIYTTANRPYDESDDVPVSSRGKVIDLILPVIVLIASCIIGMIYTGGFFDGTDFITAFADCDASLGLAMGSVIALLIIFVYLAIRRLLPFQKMMDCVPQGFKAMVPAIMILIFAWTIGGVTKSLGAPEFFSEVFKNASSTVYALLPTLVFVVAIALSFSTGTSWGTFGILLPIVVSLGLPGELLIIGISACLAGSVCGDHCSPISDTTIMSSTGARCDHLTHVGTQLPYALLVAAVSAVSYVIAGFVQNAWIALPIALVLMIGTLVLIKLLQKGSKKAA